MNKPMPNSHYLRHVHLHVGHVASVKDWYCDILELAVVFELPEQLVILTSKGNCQLGLEAGPPVSEPERVHLIFRVDDVDAVYESLSGRHDVKLRYPPTDQPYGHRVMAIQDPVGHTVELYTPLPGERAYD
jgi:catechol 2,3-dioxygenase-like lactoylglutathione lyase family enzyme